MKLSAFDSFALLLVTFVALMAWAEGFETNPIKRWNFALSLTSLVGGSIIVLLHRDIYKLTKERDNLKEERDNLKEERDELEKINIRLEAERYTLEKVAEKHHKRGDFDD